MPTDRRAPQSGGVRFAPSPTGRLHLGNLRTAWLSRELAAHLRLPWVVRFEDIDRPRVVPGAQEQQLADLRALGMIPDHILVQSDCEGRHWNVFLAAVREGRVYACDCSRKDVQAALAGLASAPHGGAAPVYSGHCRGRSDGLRVLRVGDSLAWRFRMPEASGADDFIIARSSAPAGNASTPPQRETFVPAYHWACAIDDHDGGYDWLVRGADLASALPLQRAIHAWLASSENSQIRVPTVYHTAMVTTDDGGRLEKRTRGVTLPELADSGLGIEELLHALSASIGQPGVSHVKLRESADLFESPQSIRLHSLFDR